MQRLSCDRYPCHFPDQDCTLCFCPFYPCEDERTGGRFVDGEWCCEGCFVVHREEVAKAVIEALVQGEDVSIAWKEVTKWL